MRKFLFIALILLSSPSFAAQPWEVDAGVDLFQHGLSRVSSDDSNSKSLLGSSFVNIDLQIHAPIAPSFSLSPRLMFMPNFLYPHKVPGSSVKTTYLILALPLVFESSESFDYDIGPAYLSYNVMGPGGTTELSNGNGTSTFAQPGDSVSAKTIALMLGGSYKVSGFRFSLDLFTEGLLSSSKRTFSLMVGATYAVF
jgi:hypothetical protein